MKIPEIETILESHCMGVFKKRDLQKQIDAIDRVLEMFPETKAGTTGAGLYANMSVAKAIVDLLSRTPDWFVTVAGIAAGLKAEGIKSDSKNFTTIVSTVCNRLASGKKPKLMRGTRHGRKTFAVPSREGEKK